MIASYLICQLWWLAQPNLKAIVLMSFTASTWNILECFFITSNHVSNNIVQIFEKNPSTKKSGLYRRKSNYTAKRDSIYLFDVLFFDSHTLRKHDLVIRITYYKLNYITSGPILQYILRFQCGRCWLVCNWRSCYIFCYMMMSIHNPTCNLLITRYKDLPHS